VNAVRKQLYEDTTKAVRKQLYEDMKVGDLVTIFYHTGDGDQRVIVDKMGVITEIVGYKTRVLAGGKLVPWDLFDLKTMKLRKAEHESR
jgi:hypothetical protein